MMGDNEEGKGSLPTTSEENANEIMRWAMILHHFLIEVGGAVRGLASWRLDTWWKRLTQAKPRRLWLLIIILLARVLSGGWALGKTAYWVGWKKNTSDRVQTNFGTMPRLKHQSDNNALTMARRLSKSQIRSAQFSPEPAPDNQRHLQHRLHYLPAGSTVKSDQNPAMPRCPLIIPNQRTYSSCRPSPCPTSSGVPPTAGKGPGKTSATQYWVNKYCRVAPPNPLLWKMFRIANLDLLISIPVSRLTVAKFARVFIAVQILTVDWLSLC